MKPYKCNICEKAFARNSLLAQHKYMHTGEKPYHCDICGKSFSFECNLVRHKNSHTSEKPFRCESCKKSFAQNSHLVAHRRMHTNKRVNIDSSSNLNDNVSCEVETIKKEINNEESVDDPHPIHQETENKGEVLFDYEESSDQNNINNVNELDNNTVFFSTRISY